MDITTTFHLTAREFRSAMRNSAPMRTILFASVAFVAFGLISLPSHGPEWVLLLLGLGLLVFTEMAIRRAARKSTTLLARPWTVRLTDETLALQTAMSQAEVSWNAYRDAWERSGFWYVRQANGPASFIPKRALDDAQQAELAEFFARRLPPPKVRWYAVNTWR